MSELLNSAVGKAVANHRWRGVYLRAGLQEVGRGVLTSRTAGGGGGEGGGDGGGKGRC